MPFNRTGSAVTWVRHSGADFVAIDQRGLRRPLKILQPVPTRADVHNIIGLADIYLDSIPSPAPARWSTLWWWRTAGSPARQYQPFRLP
jgi:hypothetical protein